ncbi:disease resistance protein [Corchorus olitorius]|uniref:Disease resistance protein n=1 Tax=Corchorus olitorius TaxID=93759 RepID=A0A1R3JQ12_9ROSI|nr:disease resistance protein [Corchorus olitorius]
MFLAFIAGRIPQLRNAVRIISTVGNPAVFMITAAGFSIRARDQLGLVAELRLNRAACDTYLYQPMTLPNNYDYLFINLTPFRQFLELQATDEDAVFIIHNLDLNQQRRWLTVHLLHPSADRNYERYVKLEAISNQFHVPAMMVDETPYTVTATIQSLLFCNTVGRLRRSIDGNGHITDNLRPIWITLTVASMRGDFYIQGAAAFGDIFRLWFDLTNLEAFIDAAQMSHNVLIHVEYPNRRPLLNCPFGNGLGNFFFFGN